MTAIKRFVDHPVIAVTLFLLSGFCGVIWYRANATLLPPTIHGWDWKQHPRTLILRHYSASHGCSCGRDVKPAIASAIAHGSETVIIGSEEALNDIDLGSMASSPSIHLFRTDQIISNNQDESIQAYWVKDGRIRHRFKTLPTPIEVIFK